MTIIKQRYDLLNDLAGIEPESGLGQARAIRHAATEATQASYEALFSPEHATSISLATRLYLAEYTAQLHRDETLVAHYRARRANSVDTKLPSQKLDVALVHAAKLATSPVLSVTDDLKKFRAAGWLDDEIITLAQIAGFVSYQTRLLYGLRLIAGTGQFKDSPAVAGEWHRHPKTISGRTAPIAFTQEALLWEPWLPPLTREDLSSSTEVVLKRLGILDNVYYHLLARDTPILEHRTLADRGIFFTPGGLPRAERELAATVTSKVNGCILCASVHAPRTSQFSKRKDDVQRLLDVEAGAQLSTGQEPRWAAQIEFSAQLANTPSCVGQDKLERLRQQGLDTLHLLDLVQAVAFFSWANRLMLTLGEPYQEEQ